MRKIGEGSPSTRSYGSPLRDAVPHLVLLRGVARRHYWSRVSALPRVSLRFCTVGIEVVPHFGFVVFSV